MKKRIALLLAALLLALPLLTLAEAGSQPLLYRVTDEDGHTVYLLGTIHIGREDMYPLSDAVWTAYHASDVLAVEIDMVAYAGSLLSSLRSVLGHR